MSRPDLKPFQYMTNKEYINMKKAEKNIKCPFCELAKDNRKNNGEQMTTDAAREYLTGLFKPEYTKYIKTLLAGDFAVVLAEKIKKVG